MAQVIRVVMIDGFDLTIRMDNNITKQEYCCNRMGYDVV